MSKKILPVLLLSLLAATGAHAEHKLLVTDVPEPGSIEARVDFDYARAVAKNEFFEKIADEQVNTTITVGAGIIDGLKVSASLPYTLRQRSEGESIYGFDDITLGARYVLTRSLIKLPLDIAIGLDWKLDSASSKPGYPGTGDNNLSPYLAVSKKLHLLVPYAKYQPDVILKKHDTHVVHNLQLGTEVELSHRHSIDVAVKSAVNEAHGGVKSSADLEIEVVPYLNVVSNLYLLPKVAYKLIGDVTNGEDIKVLRSAGEWKVGLGIYYLF